MPRMNILYIVTLLALACSKGGSPSPSPTPPPTQPAADSVPAQYGQPFTSVPAPADAVIYQVNMRAFSAAGNLKGVQARLDSIHALGVNVLYLMPVYPVGVLKSVNSPYCVKDFQSVATEFGSLSDLRTLVDAAHSKGMAVLFDWVADHTSWDNAWIANKAWYQQDASGNIISPLNTGWNDVAALNYTNTDMRRAMIKAMSWWVYTVNIDGYRFDAADFIPFDFWQQALDSLRKIPGHQLLFFAEGTRKDQFTAGFQLEYGMGFYYTLKDQVFHAGRSVKLIDSVNAVEYNNASSGSRVVRYTSNHDVDASDGTPLDLFGGKTGSMSVFLIAAYMKGVPMIYDGQEVGCTVKLNYFNNSTPIDWSTNPEMTAEYKKILAFYNTSPALRGGSLQSYSNDDICVFTKTTSGSTVLVVANLRGTAGSYTVPADLQGSWMDAFDSSTQQLGSQLSLAPFQYKVFQR